MEKLGIIGSLDHVGMQTLEDRLGNRFAISQVQVSDYERLKDLDYIILRVPMDRAAIEQAPRLKLIQRWGVGYDFVDIRAAGELGIQVGITAGANSLPVAEYAVLLMLAVYRQLVASHISVIQGRWKQGVFMDQAYTLANKQVGLLGLGSIGKRVAKILQGFGAKVCYHDVVRLDRTEEQSLNVSYRSFGDLLAQSDILSLHLPLNDKTKEIIGHQELAAMKSTAVLINTSRGGLIREEDLVEVLRSGTILGAGLDAFAQEPPSPDSPLLTLGNVVLSAHIAGNTVDNSSVMANKCCDNILKVYEGEMLTPPDLVNSQYLKQKEV